MDLAHLLTFENLAALCTLTALEIVLGIDNIVFIAVITGRLRPERQEAARRTGLLAAMGMRVLLLLCISWIIGLKAELFHLWGWSATGRGLILLGGGLFLLGKATFEIHHKLEAPDDGSTGGQVAASFGAAIVQIALIDIVFSLDSVITAVGMAKELAIMIAAIVIAVGVMMIFAGTVSRFVERYPTLKMLALAFLLLVGVMLVAEAFEQHIDRGYIYFAMAFSLGVEVLNIRTHRKRAAVRLNAPRMPE